MSTPLIIDQKLSRRVFNLASADSSSCAREFMQTPLGSADTPLVTGSDGRIYAENAGHLLVVGQ
jgi:hypothetical protein